MFLVNVTDTASSVQALLDSRDTMELSPLEPKPIAVAGTFAFTEQVSEQHKNRSSQALQLVNPEVDLIPSHGGGVPLGNNFAFLHRTL